jgi:predicted heme/steroid binding protein
MTMLDLPERIVTEMELRRNTGERGTRMWVAHNGIVYDVTDCARWKKGLHENQHFPGQDLTAELEQDAPHTESVFKNPCVKVIGRLKA